MKISRREAISPVIATIIIIAVTIAISLAVAAWLMGLWTAFVGGPRITASLVSITVDTNNEQVTATVYLTNEGNVKDTITGAVLINGTKTYSANSATSFSLTDLDPGKSYTVTITFTNISDAATIVGREVTVEISFKSGVKISLTGIARAS
jgi:uncharacterized protein (DUF2147 family)